MSRVEKMWNRNFKICYSSVTCNSCRGCDVFLSSVFSNLNLVYFLLVTLHIYLLHCIFKMWLLIFIFLRRLFFHLDLRIELIKKTVLFNLWCHWILGLKNFLSKKISKKYLILLFFVILLMNTLYHTRLIDLNLSFWSTTLPSCLCQFTALTSSRKNPTTRWKPKPTQRLNRQQKKSQTKVIR